MKNIFKWIETNEEYDIYQCESAGVQVRANAREIGVYKNDRFVGHVNDFRKGIPANWDGSGKQSLKILLVDWQLKD